MKENKVLATVNGKEITEEYVDGILQNLDPQSAMQFSSEDGKKKLLDELINQEIFHLEAINQGMDQEDEFKLRLEEMKKHHLTQYAINKILDNITVEEGEIHSYYNKNKDLYKTEESVQASHILVDSEEKAQEILKEINEGLAFEEAAKNYSKCPSSANGGDLGFFTRGQMVPEFENAAFTLENGEISAPVATDFGYHIIKTVDKKEAGITPLDEVKEKLTRQILTMKQNNAYSNIAEDLKKKYDVKVN